MCTPHIRIALALAVDMSAPHLANVNVLLDHIVESTSLDEAQVVARAARQADFSTEAWDLMYERAFFSRLRAYLRGVGHPDHPAVRAVIGQARFDHEQHDHLLRARLFLGMMTGKEVPPDRPDWSLRVRMLFTRSSKLT